MKKAIATIVAAAMLLTMGALPAVAATTSLDRNLANITVELPVLDSGTGTGQIQAGDQVSILIPTKARTVTTTIGPSSALTAGTTESLISALTAIVDNDFTVSNPIGRKIVISEKVTGGVRIDALPSAIAIVTKRGGTSYTVATPTVIKAESNVTTEGISRGVYVSDALISDGNGPIPFVLDKDDLNDQDGVRSNTTVYYVFKDEAYADTDYFKLDVKKATNSKDVASITTSAKNFNNETTFTVGGGNNRTAIAFDNLTKTGGRRTVIAVKLKENYTDKESKINFDFNLKITSKGITKYNLPSSAQESEKIENTGTFYVKNEVVKADDETIRVGQNGQMIEPIKNEDNTIIWYNENNDLARLQFRADSDVQKFYSKLSTQWANEDYDAYFDNQDAFIFRFTGTPKISSTSRATLDLYNPFIDDNEEETIAPEDVVIYEIVDGELKNVTDSFTYGENDDGFMSFSTKTRTLGTYIMCEQEVDAGVTDEDPIVTPSDPSIVPPVNGGKVPPNTGRYL